MKLQTVRLRRSRPSALSLALALLITMGFVYILSLNGGKPETSAAEVSAYGSAELRMEGMQVAFLCEEKCDSLLNARIAAANCAQRGGAGLILADQDGFAVIREALPVEGAPEASILRSAGGLTLKLSGPGDEISAISAALDFLRAQASETGSLAAALEGGDTDASSMAALLRIYQTQARRAAEGLNAIEGDHAVLQALKIALEAAQDRLGLAPDPATLRLLHAGACAEWLGLLEELQ